MEKENENVDFVNNRDAISVCDGVVNRDFIIPTVCCIHLPAPDASTDVNESFAVCVEEEEEEEEAIPRKKSWRKYKCWWETAAKRMYKEQK